MDIKKQEWEESYQRKENFIFYLHDECVKFLSRFIRKRVGVDRFVDVLESDAKIKGLDFGCGIGRISVLMKEFKIDSYGVDISQNAIDEAKQLAKSFDFDLDKKLSVYDGKNIPFEDDFFDFTISSCVIDSLPFELAKTLVKEIERVTKKYFFISLIASHSSFDCSFEDENAGEYIVENEHEKGTVQCFYNKNKIEELFKNTAFKVKWGELIVSHNIINEGTNARYYIVLEKS